MALEFNLFEYKGRPLANGLEVYVYAPKAGIPKENMKILMSKALSKLEVSINNYSSLIAQYSYILYCVPRDISALPAEINVDDEGNWKLIGKKRLFPVNDSEREIIRRLIADAISKKQIKRGWFVENHGFAYHWSYNLSKELRTEVMDIYPGFVFRPYVYEDGSCAVMVDPKFKLVPKRTLRDVIEDLLLDGYSKDKIRTLFNDIAIIDACPVQILVCPYKKNPVSTCWLKGAGKKRRLVRLDFTKSPSNAEIGDLIEYHRERCPFDGKIADMIVDKPPIALIRRDSSGRLLEFPLERLREELKFHKLNKWQRRLVMKYIQPPPDKRRKLTEYFATYVDDINLGRLCRLELVMSFAKAGSLGKMWKNYAYFKEMPLRFGRGAYGYQPFAGLEKNGPYDLNGKDQRDFNSLRIMLCNLSCLSSEDIRKFYHNLVDGFSRGGSQFIGMKKLFRLEIPKFSDDLLLPSVDSIINLLPERYPDIVLVFSSSIGEERKIVNYGSIKKQLTEIGVPSQFILESKLGPKVTPGKFASYLRNLALTMYYKVGGIPWVLNYPISYKTCFIGLSMLTRGERRYMSIQVFNSTGLWLGGWTESVASDKYPDILIKRIKDACNIYEKFVGKRPSRIVIHKDGEMWSNIEIDPLTEAFPSSLECASIKRVLLPRMYNLRRADFIVNRGSCVQIDKNVAILATSGPPHSVPGSQRPLTVELKSPSVGNVDLMRVCKEVFHLSQLGGYRLAVISRPITTYFSSKALSLASKYNIMESNRLWRKAWFV